MGKGKALILHLIAIAAGWGIVTALRPVVDSWQAGEEAAAESIAPSKTSRLRSNAEVAAGQKLLQRLTEARQEDSAAADPGPTLSLQQLIDESRRIAGFDPAEPAPPWNDEGKSEDETAATWEYQRLLSDLLDSYLNGSHGPDLAHAFRRGRLDAVALYDTLAVHLPGAATNDTLRRILYQELALLDPVRAAALLDSLPEKEATAAKYQTFSDGMGGYTPDTVFALLSTVPAPADGSGDANRQSIGIESALHFPQIWGSDFLPWVEQLPAGSYRDGVATTLLSRLQAADLPGYRRMRALVGDPALLENYPPR